MLVQLEETDPRPIYVQIVDDIRRALVLGTVRSGELLPSVRQLAADLRVNPNTVLMAYRELERAGVVETRRGQGTFALASPAPAETQAALALEVARRSLREAYRHGLAPEDFIVAIRRVAEDEARKP